MLLDDVSVLIESDVDDEEFVLWCGGGLSPGCSDDRRIVVVELWSALIDVIVLLLVDWHC